MVYRHSGKEQNAGRDMVVIHQSGDPHYQTTNETLAKPIHRYEDLIETKETLHEAEEKVKELSTTLHVVQALRVGVGF